MSEIITLIDLFWNWAGLDGHWKNCNILISNSDPLCFPEYEKLRNTCISLINTSLSSEELSAFLLCMALDNEDECILDACKAYANSEFLSILLQTGVTFPLPEARWQMAELLRIEIPKQAEYLRLLLDDLDPYVRKRAANVDTDIKIL